MDLTDFIKSLHILEETRMGGDEEQNLIKIILSTIGGDTYLGFALYDAIKACKSPVEIRAIGQCMSAGSLVLQAGDYRYSYPNTTFMIHKGTLNLEEASVSDALIESQEIERVVQRMLDIYEETMTISRAAIEKMLDRDSFMDAPHAKRVGLIDGIKASFIL
jgi:ATP-dependent Clp protease protease subunit